MVLLSFVATLLAMLLSANLAGQVRVMTSIVPALAYGPTCSSTLRLQNLGERTVAVELEGHRESGALVGLAGLPSTSVLLRSHEEASYRLNIKEETVAAWAKVRETVPSPDLSAVVAISASTECVTANQLRTAARGVAYPTRNPWFAGEVSAIRGDVISLINTSESTVRASACYSSGGLYSAPANSRSAPELLPICIASTDMQIPPFGSRQFPVSREGSSQLSLKTLGNAIVLEMLRPLEESLRIYAVDSSISFGNEAEK